MDIQVRPVATFDLILNRIEPADGEKLKLYCSCDVLVGRGVDANYLDVVEAYKNKLIPSVFRTKISREQLATYKQLGLKSDAKFTAKVAIDSYSFSDEGRSSDGVWFEIVEFVSCESQAAA